MKRTLTILLAVAMILFYAFMAMASGSEESVQVSGGNNSETAGETEAAEDENVTVSVGETLTNNSVDIVYNSCEIYTDYNEYIAPAAGNVIVRLEFTVNNNGTTDTLVSMYDFECYADDQACEYWYSADDDLSATVSSGRTATGAVYFEVPENAKEIEVEYETDIWTNSKAIFIVEI